MGRLISEFYFLSPDFSLALPGIPKSYGNRRSPSTAVRRMAPPTPMTRFALNSNIVSLPQRGHPGSMVSLYLTGPSRIPDL